MRLNFTILILFTVSAFLWLFPERVSAQTEFIENKGQWNANILFKCDFSTGAVFLERDGFKVVMHHPDDLKKIFLLNHGSKEEINSLNADKLSIRSVAYQVKFHQALSTQATGEKIQNGVNNYFIGNDPSKWAPSCRIFAAVSYKNLFPGIDLRFYVENNKLKYDWILHPSADPASIMMDYEGPLKLSLLKGKLLIQTHVGNVEELEPLAFQASDAGRKEVSACYRLQGNRVGIDIGKYDRTKQLIIDPAIVFSSFTGCTADNWGYTATPGPDGSFYAGGIVFGTGYPTSTGAFQTSFQGGVNEDAFIGYDMGIFKFSSNGANRLYATYLGGSGNEQPHSMMVNAQGELVVAGRSNSNDFPKLGLGQVGAGGDYDITVTKFNAAGTGIIGSVKIGGTRSDGVNINPKYRNPGPDALRRNYGDDARSEVMLDPSGNILLASCTQSQDFPVLGTSLNTNAGFGGGRQDGVLLRFNANLTARSLSTYFGGTGDDACFVLGLHPVTGNIYVGGSTTSYDLPGNRNGVIPTGINFQGGISDGFIVLLNATGSVIQKLAYIGTNGTDMLYGLKLDNSGNPYVMGTTTGNWPVINANYSNAGAKQFICKLQPDLSSYVYSTVFGKAADVPSLSPIAFLVDRCENVYVSGWGGGINNTQGYTSGNTSGFPTVNALPSSLAPDDGQDFYFFVMSRNADSQLFGSSFGQNGGLGDHVDGGTSRFDENGIIYQALCANCGNNVVFPTTAGVWAPRNGSSSCNQAAVKINMDFSGVKASLRTSINAVPYRTKGCVPLTVYFNDTLSLGKKYYWFFGDGRTGITATAVDSITYSIPGIYTVTLIAEDSSTCNIRDTATITIIAGNNEAIPDFSYRKLPPCSNLSYVFNNLSTATIGSFGSNSFVWDFGDGSAPITASAAAPITHTFPAMGSYVVTLTIQDTSFCNTPVQIQKTIRISTILKADFNTNAVGCLPYNAVFNNTSSGGIQFIWQFGDGTSSTDPSMTVTHLYNQAGSYNVRLIAIDSNTCNIIDTSVVYAVTVVNGPTASFSWAPNPPQPNVPISFTNLSTGALRYLWYFGDGDTSTLSDPAHLFNSSGDYQVTLIAFNQYGCTDTFIRSVNVLIDPLLDVPNAFTPGKFGTNGVISVRGFGIRKMQWRIYNRWGQLVFESDNPNKGWDGSFQGKPQPMGVYVYTLEAELEDGRPIKKTGDISLLR